MTAAETIEAWKVAHPKFIESRTKIPLSSSYLNWYDGKTYTENGVRVFLSGLPGIGWMLVKGGRTSSKYRVLEVETCAVLTKGETLQELADRFIFNLGIDLKDDETVPDLVWRLVKTQMEEDAKKETRLNDKRFS